STAVLEPAAGRHARRADREGQDPLLRVVRVRARAGDDLREPVAPADADLQRPVSERAEELPRARGRSAVAAQPAVAARVALELGEPVSAADGRSSVARVGSD